MTKSTLVPHLFYGFGVISLLLTSTSCIWRAADTDHLWGPTLIRANQPPEGKVYLWQERSVLPLALEGGDYVSLTIGFLNRLAANPIENDKQIPLLWCSGLFLTICSTPTASDGWHWSFLYGRIVHISPPEFFDRSVLGASVGIGDDGNYLTLGYSANTQHIPQNDAHYILCYGRANPLRTRFALTRNTSEFVSFLNQEACQ